MFPHTITVFNKVEDGDDTVYYPTVLRKTLFSYKTVKTTSNEGVLIEGNTLVVIPSSFISSKNFISIKDYNLVEGTDRDNVFTLNNEDIVVKGRYEGKALTKRDIFGIFSEVATVVGVKTYDYGLKHWSLVCK